MIVRALIGAALALLVSGDIVRLGWDAVGLWRFVFPYVWLFVLLEMARSRLRIGDDEAFAAGAAMSLLYGGIYTKDLQFGLHPFGVDWLGVLSACFDAGMTTVLALHLTNRLRQRDESNPVEVRPAAIAFVISCLVVAAVIYGLKTAFNVYRGERLLGPSWLVADILFAAVAWMLVREVVRRAKEPSRGGRDPWIWNLSGFAVWIPGARFFAQTSVAFDWSDASMYAIVAVWTAVVVFCYQKLRRECARRDLSDVALSRPALTSALWRVIGALLLVAFIGSQSEDPRTAGMFSAVVEWPSRALFAWAFLTSRLKL